MSIRKLSPELQKKAEEELNEKPSRIQEDLKHIREWLTKQPHLKVRDDDQTLVGFLRGCKYSLQRTKEKVDYFHAVRTTMPDLYDDRDTLLPKMQHLLKSQLIAPLTKTADAASPRVILFRFENSSSETMCMADFQKMYMMTVDILLNEDDNSIIAGIMFVIDFSGYNLNFLTQLTPTFMQQFTLCMQVAYPVRLKGMHLVNVPSAFVKVFEVVRPILGKKLGNRVFFYSEANASELYKNIPKSILPEELGGYCGPVSEMMSSWQKKVESYRNHFLEDAIYRTNEKLRIGESKIPTDIFGVEGSFRKLNVD